MLISEKLRTLIRKLNSMVKANVIGQKEAEEILRAALIKALKK